MTDVYVISGFLGAGKTTWIQKLLKDAFKGKKTVLIENDFGKESVDAALLSHQGVQVTEINSGCICCSLAGDFVKAIKEILNRFAPEVLLIEPSGVGKLSDVVRACQNETVRPFVHLAGKMTVVDVSRYDLYMENFGEFFEDQIHEADILLLSHVSGTQDKIGKTRLALHEINNRAPVFDAPWDTFSAGEVLNLISERKLAGEPFCGHSRLSHCAEFDHDLGDDHVHDAEDVFESLSLSTEYAFTRRELEECFQKIVSLPGNIVRAKGVFPGKGVNWLVQYVPGQTEIEPVNAPVGIISFIGQKLNNTGLMQIFHGK